MAFSENQNFQNKDSREENYTANPIFFSSKGRIVYFVGKPSNIYRFWENPYAFKLQNYRIVFVITVPYSPSIKMLKVSAFYLDKQKSFVLKKDSLLG